MASNLVALAPEVGPGAYRMSRESATKKTFVKITKLGAVLKFLVFSPLSTNHILTFVEDFKSISTPSKEKSNSEVANILGFLTLLSPKLASGPQAEAMRTNQFD